MVNPNQTDELITCIEIINEIKEQNLWIKYPLKGKCKKFSSSKIKYRYLFIILKKTEEEAPVGPLLLGVFLFLVVGSGMPFILTVLIFS